MPTQLSEFAKRVLQWIEPDSEKARQWIKKRELAPVCQQPCMNDFCQRLERAIENDEKVLVAGDYDADGILATSIMVDGCRNLGLETGFYIPDRIREGYGLKASTVQLAKKKGYSLIITVDNGVRADQALKEARKLGIEVIVTDHHSYEKDPDCDIIIHPDLMEEPFDTLCGAGVAYECMRAMGMNLSKYLQWAAVASVADCMQVSGQTRALIQSGIDLLNKQGDPHILWLTKDRQINETSLGFQTIPRINAIGRLSNIANANTLVKYFLSENAEQIHQYSLQMEEVNTQRKKMSEQMYTLAAAKVQIARPVLLVSDPSFHEGIIGLVAGQLCSQYFKPAIVASENPDGYKCSMRAPEGFHCMEFLEKFDHYLALGGHQGAAGFTVLKEYWDEFRNFVFTQGFKEPFEAVEEKPMPIYPTDINPENIASLDELRPFGTGFKCPRFVLEDPQIVSVFDMSAGKHRKFTLKGGAVAIHFNQSSQDMSKSVLSIRKLIGTLSTNWYNGRVQANLIIDEIIYD